MTNILNKSVVEPLFVYLNTGVTNVTGNGAVYTILFDTVVSGGANYSSGVFTAPISGTYLACGNVALSNITSGANGMLGGIGMGSLNMRFMECGSAVAKDVNLALTVNSCYMTQMTAGTTATVSAVVSNGTQVVGVSGGTAPYKTWFFIKYLG